jgi:hypothetical protein
MERPFSLFYELPNSVIVETCAAQGSSLDLEGWSSSGSQLNVETGPQHTVHNLLEGLARPSCFGSELCRHIVV